MTNKINKKLKKLLSTLHKSGLLDWAEKLKTEFPKAEIYLVGGAVRDAILNRAENKDFDFVARKVPMKKLQTFLNKLGWVEELGKNFGVLKFKPEKLIKDENSSPLDIALPRKEISTSQGDYKDFKVEFDKNIDIKHDLLRRDFTINAIALDIFKNQIIDPFSGIKDIKNKIIKCVGKPEERLKEDYTRILRAVRFACQLNFEIGNKTKIALKKLALRLNDKNKSNEWISPREVIAKEFLKALSNDYLKAIELYDKLGLFKILMPEILKMKKCPQPKNYHTEGDVWKHTILALKKINSPEFKKFEKKLDKIFTSYDKERLELILAVLFHDIGKPYTIQTPKKNGTDRIRFNNHDNIGGKLTEKICRRLALSTPPGLGINYDTVAWPVSKHMIMVHGHPNQLRSQTIEKYFFSGRYPGKNLIKLAYLDSLATITTNGPVNTDLISALLKRIKEMKKLVKKKHTHQSLPAPLLSGNEIMQILKLKPGKKIGQIKNKIREKQLDGQIKNKKQAKGYVSMLK
ncbi:HD domain-containing protein [Candidatus Parcubacteria bacterium]|nr:HD domain-containing protein [Candidatus Parcubacteria bacterium]